MDYSETVKIDLHIHSTASDGTFSPEEIVAKACDLRLGAIAITDHDTIDGTKTAICAGIPSSIEFLTGVEISSAAPSSFPCSGSFHILGYAISLDYAVLNETLDTLQDARRKRNPEILERLCQLGMGITFRELTEHFGKTQIGRPHIAHLMVEKGYAESIDDAFDKYLSKGRPAYVGKYRIECNRAIEVIRSAGGIPVLAHPALLKPNNDQPIENLIRILKDMGLEGIEIYYPQHSADHIQLYSELAKRYDLLVTGGTDFHGSIKPEIQMGTGKGDLFVPYRLYEKLMERVKR